MCHSAVTQLTTGPNYKARPRRKGDVASWLIHIGSSNRPKVTSLVAVTSIASQAVAALLLLSTAAAAADRRECRTFFR